MDRRRLPGPTTSLSGLLRASALASSVVLMASSAAVAAGDGAATYRVEATTIAGIGAGGSGMEMMRMLMGGGQPAARRDLDLLLSSGQRPTAAPQAEHMIPAALTMGTSLPLLTPPPTAVAQDRAADDELREFKGRLVIFRGCAGSATADQPEVIELAGLSPDQRRLAQAMASRKGWDEAEPARAVTTGVWPTIETEKPVPANGSLVGEHRVQSNYAPEIRFQVTASHDFLAPVQLSTRSAGEAMELSWKPVATALGSQAMAVGAKESGTEIVLWTSSSAPWGESSVPAALDAATARKLISSGALMPPEQTTCTIGAAAMKRLGDAVVSFTAYGEALRTAGPVPAPGRPPLWTLTLERTSASTIPLMEMEGMQGGAPGEQPMQEAPQKRGGWGLIPGLF